MVGGETVAAVAAEMDEGGVREVGESLVKLWFNKMAILVLLPHEEERVELGLVLAHMDRAATLHRRDGHATRKRSIFMNDIIIKVELIVEH
jgi:hypothetical protein